MKRVIASLLVIAILMAYPVYSAISIILQDYNACADITEGNAMLSDFEDESIDNAQKNIDATRKKRAEAVAAANLKAKIEESITEIENGNKSYRQVFNDVYIAGDSLMYAIAAYDILNYNHTIAEVNAGFNHLNTNFDKIVKLRPPILILHYGINMISSKESKAQRFARQYTDVIQRLKEALPNTRIIVSLIFPVDTTIAQNERFTGIDRYNELLIEMCEKENIEYLDSSAVVKANTKYYGDDGIHFSKKFYSEHWLKHVMREVKIY